MNRGETDKQWIKRLMQQTGLYTETGSVGSRIIEQLESQPIDPTDRMDQGQSTPPLTRDCIPPEEEEVSTTIGGEGRTYVEMLHISMKKEKGPVMIPKEALNFPAVPGDLQVYPVLIKPRSRSGSPDSFHTAIEESSSESFHSAAGTSYHTAQEPDIANMADVETLYPAELDEVYHDAVEMDEVEENTCHTLVLEDIPCPEPGFAQQMADYQRKSKKKNVLFNRNYDPAEWDRPIPPTQAYEAQGMPPWDPSADVDGLLAPGVWGTTQQQQLSEYRRRHAAARAANPSVGCWEQCRPVVQGLIEQASPYLEEAFRKLLEGAKDTLLSELRKTGYGNTLPGMRRDRSPLGLMPDGTCTSWQEDQHYQRRLAAPSLGLGPVEKEEEAEPEGREEEPPLEEEERFRPRRRGLGGFAVALAVNQAFAMLDSQFANDPEKRNRYKKLVKAKLNDGSETSMAEVERILALGWEDAPGRGGARCDPDFAGRTLASGAGPLHRESTFRATPVDKVREQALLDKRAARDRMAIRLYVGLACLTLTGLVASILWYFGILQRWYATYTE